jgi:hypothetical protein
MIKYRKFNTGDLVELARSFSFTFPQFGIVIDNPVRGSCEDDDNEYNLVYLIEDRIFRKFIDSELKEVK